MVVYLFLRQPGKVTPEVPNFIGLLAFSNSILLVTEATVIV
jgi:hypothetical protein